TPVSVAQSNAGVGGASTQTRVDAGVGDPAAAHRNRAAALRVSGRPGRNRPSGGTVTAPAAVSQSAAGVDPSASTQPAGGAAVRPAAAHSQSANSPRVTAGRRLATRARNVALA